MFLQGESSQDGRWGGSVQSNQILAEGRAYLRVVEVDGDTRICWRVSVGKRISDESTTSPGCVANHTRGCGAEEIHIEDA